MDYVPFFILKAVIIALTILIEIIKIYRPIIRLFIIALINIQMYIRDIIIIHHRFVDWLFVNIIMAMVHLSLDNYTYSGPLYMILNILTDALHWYLSCLEGLMECL